MKRKDEISKMTEEKDYYLNDSFGIEEKSQLVQKKRP